MYILISPYSSDKSEFSDILESTSHTFVGGKRKGKAFPLQAWTGPEGSRKLRFQDFVTTAKDGGKVVSLTHRVTHVLLIIKLQHQTEIMFNFTTSQFSCFVISFITDFSYKYILLYWSYYYFPESSCKRKCILCVRKNLAT